jgi:simple sugar transport system substrate-binding protein
MRVKGSWGAAAAAMAVVVVLAGCSASGGKETDEGSAAGTGAGKADTPRVKIAMITHEAPGDAFWDRIRKGAEAAAEKGNVELVYSNDPQAPKQADLVQNAIDQKVDAIAATLSNPDAIGPVIKKAADAGIPVVLFNAGLSDTVLQDTGALMYFGQDETIAGRAVADRLVEDGAKNVVCVVHEQGQVQLEARCDGVEQGLSGGKVQKLYVNGRNQPSVLTDIQAKLAEDKSVDHVVTLGADFALTAIKAVDQAGSSAKVVTFDLNQDLVNAIQDGTVEWAVDQQPYVQGYEAIDSLWLYLNNGNTIGGGREVLTGPAFVDDSNADVIAPYAKRGTR